VLLNWPAALFSGTRVLIIAGKGGAPEYTERFKSYAQRLQNALVTHHHFAPEQIVVLSENETASSPPLNCTAQNVDRVFSESTAQLKKDDQFVVVLFGHGSSDGAVSKFNLAGPDLRDLDFARLLERVPAQRQIFVNTTAASAGFIEKLARHNRIVITATRSPEENFTTQFPEYFVEAFEKKDEADLNKDQQVAMLEAFDYARDQTVRFYEQANRLRPEHALLEDNGEGAGSETPANYAAGPASASDEHVQKNDGALAAQTNLISEGRWASGAAPATSATPSSMLAASHPLAQKKLKLLGEIESVKAQKGSMPVAEYERKLEALFIELAKLNREIKKASP
jgi:hypothetical protein